MNLEAIKALVMSKTARQVLLTKKHSPTILMAAGAVGVVGTVVLACRATLKTNEVLENHEKKALDISDTSQQTLQESVNGVEKRSNDLAKLKFSTAIEIAKLYAPAAGLLVVSLGALTGSHVILSKRNGALMATYATLDKAYKEYRQRVVAEFGEDTDRKFALAGEGVVVEEKTADGTIKTTTKEGPKGRFGGSPYAVVFDEQSRFWTREPGANSDIVMMKQNWANDKLRAQGHLFLNEVYDMLGLPRTKEGAVVGWVLKENDPSHVGDNFITFNVFEGDSELVDGFLDGSYKYVLIDPNVDGVIYDKI